MKLWKCIERSADRTPDRPALGHLTYLELKNAVLHLQTTLPEIKDKKVGLLLDNGPLWGLYDIALTLGGAIVVPIPTFFSDAQVSHIISDGELELVFTKSGSAPFEITELIEVEKVIDIDASSLKTQAAGDTTEAADLKELAPERIVKIIYTSGTTGKPKGVMIRQGAIDAVTSSLAKSSGANMSDRHLSLLPLSTLLENIGGLYLPLTVGASVIYPTIEENDRTGPSAAELTRLLYKSGATTIILVPGLLGALIEIIKRAGVPVKRLRYVAIGGALCSEELLSKAAELSIPVYQGYGLSECTSVVTANSIGFNRSGSVGKVLPHAAVKISDDGEIVVSGDALMAGYIGSTESADTTSWPTGDLGRIDDDGYLYFIGRKDNQFKTAGGRKISPEWVELEALKAPAVNQVLVLGEGKAELSALVLPEPRWFAETSKRLFDNQEVEKSAEHPAMTEAMLEEILKVSGSLPEYARIKSLLILTEPFSIENGLTTPDGRLKRREILDKFKTDIERLS